MFQPIKSLFRYLLLLLSCLPLPGLAEQLLQPFDVTYSYSSGIKTAEVRISLQPDQQHWRWRTEVSPGSFLALFSDERPYTDTLFSIENREPRLKRIELGSDSNLQPTEAAEFNWSEKKMESLRKTEQRRLPLMQTVYDSNTVHLLAQDLYFSAASDRQASFYHKGELTTVSIQYQGLKTINQGDKDRQVELFSLQRNGSDSLLLYYYYPGEMLWIVIIEQQEPGESRVIMTLQEDQS